MKTQTRIGLAIGLALALLAGLAPRAGALVTASGGNYTNDILGYRIHVFTNSAAASNFVVSAASPGDTIEVLVVAGGGGGGKAESNQNGDGGGGGGAGGFVYSNAFQVVAGSNYTVTIGGGGPGATVLGNQGGNGTNSVFDTIIAYGGGGGGSDGTNGAGGGSGGGAGSQHNTSYSGGPATNGQGNAGGNTTGGTGPSSWGPRGGAGGGGAGAPGRSEGIGTPDSYSDGKGRPGGGGAVCAIIGSNVVYAGGGGGGGCATTGGAGGTGGGGAGGGNNAAGTAGTANTGGGGGGGGSNGGGTGGGNGGSGGSGIVIVRYATMSATGGNITEVSGDRIHTFVNSGLFTLPEGKNVAVLVVGGGGGGGMPEVNSFGDGAGGGGAGGVVYNASTWLAAGTYSVTVGAGGAGSSVLANRGGNGGDSVFNTIRAYGGGGGGSDNNDSAANNGASGGSGGGAANWYSNASSGGSGTNTQGSAGAGCAASTSNRGAAGGGGATGNGITKSGNAGGAGGTGTNISITGSSVGYAGGGGGGACGNNTGGGAGSGGGGAGGSDSDSKGGIGGDGTIGTGGGGGGGGAPNGSLTIFGGGNGGSGIVIVRYAKTGIDLQPVANLTTNSVQLIATLIGSSADLYAFWDTQDRGMNFTWAYTNSPLTAFTNTAAGATITNTATGLAPLTQYAYRFYGTNTASGWSGWSAAGSFSTPGPPTVNNTNGVTGLGLGTATLNGVVTATNGAVCYGKIFWGPTDGSNNAAAWAYTNDIAGTAAAGTPFSVTLSNLLYGVQYYYRAAASNSYGLGWATNSLGFVTPVPIAGPAGTAGTVSYTTANSYTFAAAANNLIAGMAPSATNNPNQPHAGGATDAGLLTDGSIPGWAMGNTYTIYDNSTITYTLGSAALGYTISNVNIFSLWGALREDITLTGLSYSTYDAPDTFTTIPGSAVNYAASAQAVVRYSATGSGLAVGVKKIRFDFGNQENHYVGYGELEVVGAATPAALAVGISNTPASSVTSTSAVMNATLSATGSVFSVYGYYWTNGAASSNVVSIGQYTNAVSTNLSSTLSALLPGTGYAYTFLATNAVTNFWASPAASFTTAVATVTLTTTVASAYEHDTAPTAGVFTVSRGGVTNGALNVCYSISGGATPGAGVGGDFTNNPAADYANKTGLVTIVNGADSATVSIWPVDDSTPEPPESVILTLLTNASYIVGSPSNDTVTIYDDDAGNIAPVVTIPGGNQYLLSNSLPIVATLAGSVTDDGQPNPPGVVSQLWTKVSGPGTVTFGNATNTTTTANFSAEGVYVLQLWADDSALQASNTVTVSVYLRQVSVQATDALGRTNASDNAAFTVYRPVTCTNETLAIYYTLGGTAVNNTDYSIAPVSGAVSLTPGQTNAVITVTPVYKQAIQQTVILNLTPGLYALGAQSSATCTLAQVTGPDRYWVAASAGNWSDTNNWSMGSGGPGGSSVPGSGSVAIFDGAGGANGNCNLDASANVAGVLITNAYAGTITQGASVTVGASGWHQASGTFAGGSQAIAMNGPFSLSGGTFTGTSGTLTMKGNWTHTGGTFSHNNGTVAFYCEWRVNQPYLISVPTTETFNNLSVSSYEDLALDLNGNTVVVLGTFANNGGNNQYNLDKFDNGTLELRGNMVIAVWAGAGTANVKLSGSANQTYTTSGGVPPGGTWTIDKSGGALTLLTDLSLTASGQQLVWTNGAVDLSSNKLTAAGAVTVHPGATALGVTVADATKAGLLVCNGGVTSITNVTLAVQITAPVSEFEGRTYTILSNSVALGVATFESVTWPGKWIGDVSYASNGNRNVTISNISLNWSGASFRIR